MNDFYYFKCMIVPERPSSLRKHLPAHIHFGCASVDTKSSQKRLTIWGFAENSKVDCVALRDDDYGIDVMSQKEHVKRIGELGKDTQGEIERECNVKFKAKHLVSILKR